MTPRPRRSRPSPQAKGEVEFYTDGVTVERFRRLAGMPGAQRAGQTRGGRPASPENWANRVLPTPTVRIAWASMAACEQQGLAWESQSEKFGVIDDEHLSVLADGAKWIWDQARQCWRCRPVGAGRVPCQRTHPRLR